MMLLWSMHVEYQGGSYSTQFNAENPNDALDNLLASGSIAQVFKANGVEHDGELSSDDILYVIPMDGLDGMWLSQIGRYGIYISVLLVNTIRSSPKKDI